MTFRARQPGCACCEETCDIAVDSFDRADSEEIGAAWSIASGAWSITSNVLTCDTSGVVIAAASQGITRGQYVTCLVRGGDGDRLRIVVDADENGIQYHYAEVKVGSSATLRVVRVDDGVESELETMSVSAAANTWLRFTVCISFGISSSSHCIAVLGPMESPTATLGVGSITRFNGWHAGLAASGTAAQFDEFAFSHRRGPDKWECPDCSQVVGCNECEDSKAAQFYKVVIAGVVQGTNEECENCDVFNGTFLLSPAIFSCGWLHAGDPACPMHVDTRINMEVGWRGEPHVLFVDLATRAPALQGVVTFRKTYDSEPDCDALIDEDLPDKDSLVTLRCNGSSATCKVTAI